MKRTFQMKVISSNKNETNHTVQLSTLPPDGWKEEERGRFHGSNFPMNFEKDDQDYGALDVGDTVSVNVTK